MDGEKKEGVSVKEIEEFAKKHRYEVFFCVLFVIACFFTFVMWGAGLSIVASSVGAIIGVLLTSKVEQFSKKLFSFVFKHEQTVQLILAGVGIILAIFLAPLIFFLLGMHGGKEMHRNAMDSASRM
ncbi:MAG: hypothetical protein JSS61_02840 [Verrucomicrobia bacterium]|nr:hypothetical protein [Verrucomicrobiota bacterium]